MKKILVAINRQQSGSYNESLLSKYLEDVQAKGYVIDIIDDYSGDVYRLLEEMPLINEFSPFQKDVLDHIQDYEHIVYVPSRALELKDVLVYRMEKENFDPKKAQETVAKESAERRETGYEHAISKGEDTTGDFVSGSEVSENALGQTDWSKPENGNAQPTSVAHTVGNIDINDSPTHQRNPAEQSVMSSPEIGITAQKTLQRISLEEMHELTTETRSAVGESAAEEEGRKSKGLSMMRRLRLAFPWVVMAIMAYLGYEKTTILPFILTIFGLLAAGFSKKYKSCDKTPEWLSVFLAAISWIVSLAHPKWMAAISMPISCMAIALFILVGFVNWDH